MATLPVKVIPHGGLSLGASDYAAATASPGNDKAPTGPGVVLLVKNGDASAHTVTLAVPETVDSLTVNSRTVPVPAGDTGFIPLLDLYKDPADGLATFTYDAVTSVTVAVIRAA
jgi:hypothetical protein